MYVNVGIYGDPRSFMYYCGKYYINGTEIILKEQYTNSHTFNGKKIWKYARFDRKTVYNGVTSYFFCATKLDWFSLQEMGLTLENKKDYATYFVIETFNIDSAIEEITKAIILTEKESDEIKSNITNMIEHQKTDFDYPELMMLWVVYAAVIIGSLIFKQFYIIWLIASYVFFVWRKDILNR